MKHFDTYFRGRRFTAIPNPKPLETQSKMQGKAIKKITEAWTKYNFDIKNNQGSDMPVDILSLNAVDTVGIFDDNCKMAQ